MRVNLEKIEKRIEKNRRITEGLLDSIEKKVKNTKSIGSGKIVLDKSDKVIRLLESNDIPYEIL